MSGGIFPQHLKVMAKNVHPLIDKESDGQSQGGGRVWVILWFFGSCLAGYFFAFAVLVLFPPAGKAAVALGVSEGVLDTIFYPIMKLLGQ
jgi:hypothetical protein